MALLEKQLFIRKSTIPNSGKGLFTKKFIPKGTRIVEYKGRITNWKEVKDQDGNNPYIFYVKRNHVIDALPAKRALARYANDANGIVRVKGIRNNADYITDGLKAYIEARTDIPAGAEILVDYGKDYWNVIRHNLRLEREEAKRKKNARAKRTTPFRKRRVDGQKILQDVKHSKDKDSTLAPRADVTRKTRQKKSLNGRKSISKQERKAKVRTE